MYGLIQTAFRSTQFGCAPEIIIQRPDFRLAAGSTVRRMKQNKDAVWSLVLLLVTGVRAELKYSYSYDITLYVYTTAVCT